MNNDLISRSELLEWVQNQKAEASGVYGNIIKAAIDAVLHYNVANAIRNAPTVDAEPVRHGRLVSTGTDELYCEWGDCTVCGSDNRINAKFCNNCGAKIEGVVTK